MLCLITFFITYAVTYEAQKIKVVHTKQIRDPHTGAIETIRYEGKYSEDEINKHGGHPQRQIGVGRQLRYRSLLKKDE